MAIIGFITTGNKVEVSISGSITPNTTKLLHAYAKKNKLDIQSTTIKPEYGVNPLYLKERS